MTDYKDMADAEKVEYLEKRVAALVRANQTLTDSMADATQKIAVVALKLEAAGEKARTLT